LRGGDEGGEGVGSAGVHGAVVGGAAAGLAVDSGVQRGGGVGGQQRAEFGHAVG
jgi:hypothetical protein